jgi:hypothetical protein
MQTTVTRTRQTGPLRDDLASTWEEIGLAEFPVVTTSLKRPPFDSIEFVERLPDNAQGQPVQRVWKMVGSKEYGLPRLPDLDIFVAILKLLERHRHEKKLVACTANEICEIAGIGRGGQTYDRIRGALIRFQTTSYVAQNHFTDPKTGERVISEGWDIVTDHRIVADRGRELREDGLPASYIAVSSQFLNRLKTGKLKPVDLALWRELPLGLEKPIFHYLDKNLYQKSRHEVGLRKLSQRIGLTGTYKVAQLKRLCEKPLSTLVAHEFLKGFHFEPSKMAEDPWKLVVVPGPRARGIVRHGVRHQDATNQASTGRTTQNSTMPGAERRNDRSLRSEYQEWLARETDRRFKALRPDDRERRVAEALAEMQKGKHGEVFRTSPDYFQSRLAENRVRRVLSEDLPSFEEWRKRFAPGSLTSDRAA